MQHTSGAVGAVPSHKPKTRSVSKKLNTMQLYGQQSHESIGKQAPGAAYARK